MVNNYIRKTEKQYDYESMQKALKLIKTGQSIRSSAKQCSIPEATLRGWVNGRRFGGGIAPTFNKDEEKIIIDALTYSAKSGIPIGRNELQNMVQSYLRSVKKKNPFTNDRPGRRWVEEFINRNEYILKERNLEFNSQAKVSYNKSPFFYLYEKLLSQKKIKNNSYCIFNLEESILKTKYVRRSKGTGKICVIKKPNPYEICRVMFSKSSSGVYLPPFTIYNAERMQESWTKGGPEKAEYDINDSSCMMNKNFENWFHTIFLKFVGCYEKPVILTYKGPDCHLTYDSIKSAIDNEIIILCLLPNTSHSIQSLDVQVFPFVNEEWEKILNSWFYKTQNTAFDMSDFPKLLEQLWNNLLPANDFVGFKDSELITSPDNCFGDVQSAMTTSGTNETKEDSETDIEIKVYSSQVESQQPYKSKDKKAAMKRDKKRKARFKKVVIQNLQEEQRTNDVAPKELTPSDNCFEEIHSAVSTSEYSETIIDPAKLTKMVHNALKAVSLQSSKDEKTVLEQNKKRKYRLEETVIDSFQGEQTRTVVASVNSFVDSAMQALSPQPSNGVNRALEQNRKRKARFEEIMMQSLQEVQKKQEQTHENEQFPSEGNFIEMDKQDGIPSEIQDNYMENIFDEATTSQSRELKEV